MLKTVVIADLLAAAEPQHGLLTSGQLRGAGLSEYDVKKLHLDGWIRLVRRGVYEIAGHPPSAWRDPMAAQLVAPDAVLSHRTAAAIHRVHGLAQPEAVELTVVRPKQLRLRGVIVHRVPRLDPEDLAHWHGMAVTSAARTIVDLAPRLPDRVLAKAIDEGCIARLWSIDQLWDVAKRAGTRGTRKGLTLHRLLAERSEEARQDSLLETRVLRVLAPLAPFEVHFQVVLDGHVVILDVAWPRAHVAVEADGWSVRAKSRTKFDHERRKANLLVAHGWTVVYVTSVMTDAEILSSVLRVLPRGAALGA